MDRISILGLELWMRIGCTREERAFPQRLKIDIHMERPLQAAGTQDDIRHSLDYAQVVGKVKKGVEPKSYKLTEAVAEEIAKVVRKYFKTKSVRVVVRKEALPGIQCFEVEIERP